jgi:hypothetical protein
MRITWMQSLTLVGCLAGSALAPVANAQLINGDLESGTYVFDGNGAASLAPGSLAITGWQTFNGELAVINNANNFGLTAQSGTKSLDLTGYHDSSPYGAIQQTVNTLPGQNYSLTFYLGSNGGTASILVDTGVTSTTFSNTGGVPFWQQFTQNFTATGPTVLKFTGTVASGGGNYIGLDHIALAGTFGPTATPEPGSAALLGTSGVSLLGLLASRRRAKKKSV